MLPLSDDFFTGLNRHLHRFDLGQSRLHRLGGGHRVVDAVRAHLHAVDDFFQKCLVGEIDLQGLDVIEDFFPGAGQFFFCHTILHPAA